MLCPLICLRSISRARLPKVYTLSDFHLLTRTLARNPLGNDFRIKIRQSAKRIKSKLIIILNIKTKIITLTIIIIIVIIIIIIIIIIINSNNNNNNDYDVGNYRPITCLPIMWKVLTGIIAEDLHQHYQSSLLPDEQKGCRKERRGKKDQLVIHRATVLDCEHLKTNLAMAICELLHAVCLGFEVSLCAQLWEWK